MIFLNFTIVALSFVCGKYYPIRKLTMIKNLSHDLQLNYIISFYFHLYLTIHACAARFDVTRNLKNFLVFGVN